MKKLIRSIIAFFSSDKKEEPIDPNYSKIKTAFWESLPQGQTYYTVCSENKILSYERNLMGVSRKYPCLKKSTLYRAFKGDPDNSLFMAPRTYVKNNFKVIECQKF